MYARENDERVTQDEDCGGRTARGHRNLSARTQKDYIDFRQSTRFGSFSLVTRPPQSHINSTRLHNGTIDPQVQSLLFRLPVELRLDIYEHLLRIPESASSATITNRPNHPDRPSALSILLICRRALDEAQELFYSINRLVSDYPSDFLASLNPRRRSAITKFTLLVANAASLLALLRQLHVIPTLTSLHIKRKAGLEFQNVREWAVMASQLVAEIRKMERLTEVNIMTPGAPLLDAHSLTRKHRMEEVDARICGAVWREA